MPMQRRNFVRTALATAAAAPFVSTRAAAPKKKILLRSSWQTVNIGDIAHTPGMLTLLEKHCPDYEITLWPSRVDNGVDEILMKRFPKLKIMEKTGEAKAEAFESCDFLLHGSGPG
ncbi:MAG: polysaccharide pyruvyl transferase, partial [Verrucomicrobiales bacterium]|nr:polysaccharide pyruvyl transferase [Verrucomicrobiales bacterium]